MFTTPQLDFSCPYALSVSVYKTLKYERNVSRFKVVSSLLGLITTLLAIFCFGNFKDTQEIMGVSFSVLINCMAIEDSIQSKMNLLSALQHKINEMPEETLKKRYLDLLFKIVKSQSFQKI